MEANDRDQEQLLRRNDLVWASGVMSASTSSLHSSPWSHSLLLSKDSAGYFLCSHQGWPWVGVALMSMSFGSTVTSDAS